MNKAEITLQDIFRTILSHLIVILLVGALFGAGAWFYTKKYVPKMYRTSITFYAVSNTQKGEDSAVTTSEQASSRQLASTYSVFFKSNRVMKEASERLAEKGIKYSFSALKNMTTVTTTNTEIFTATFSTSDRKNIKVIADTIADAAVHSISEIVGRGEAKIIDYAEEPGSPYSPDVKSNVIAFTLAGILLSGAVVVIRALTDTTVWTEEDLTKRYNIPVLGSIPQLTALEKTGNAKE